VPSLTAGRFDEAVCPETVQTAARIGRIMAMKTKFTKRNKGFTIIELMIVLVIVAILLALAYPSYIDYVRKGKRGDAQQALLNWAVNQEIWRSNHPTYAGTGDLPAPSLDNYDLRFSADGAPTATTYTLEAAAKNDQVNDKARNGNSCATLTLDQSGVKSPPECWE
jgi:type IV pilus assembly protein PilE